MDKYVTPEEFAKLSKGKKVKEYPNPLVKEVNGVCYEICTEECTCTVSKLPREHYRWYTGWTFEQYQKFALEEFGEENSEIIVISTNTKAGYSWFPAELVCGTKRVYLGAGITRSVFSTKSDLAKQTGCLLHGENGGTFECYFRSARVNEAIKILNENHFKCEEYKG